MSQFKQTDIFTSIIVFFLYFVLSVLAAPPGIVGGDGAEIIYGISTLTQIHPPGYPLYQLLGFSLQAIFSLSPSMAAHLLSGFFMALALGFFYIFLRFKNISLLSAIVVLASLGLSQPLWTSSVMVEVYSLAAFFFVVTLLLRECVLESMGYRRLLWFWVGLSLTHHPIGLVNVLLAIQATTKQSERVKLIEIFLFVLPGLFYLALFISGSGFPFNWPEIGNLVAFQQHLFGGQLTRFFVRSGWWTLPQQFFRLFIAHLIVFPLLLVLIPLKGYWLEGVRTRSLIITQVLLLVGLSFHNIPDLAPFLLPSYFITAVYLGFALDFYRKASLSKYGFVLTLCLLSLLGFYGYYSPRYDYSQYDYPRQYANNVEQTINNGVILSDWSHYTILRYYQLQQDYFEKVQLFSPTHNFERWNRISLDHLQKNVPVYVTHDQWADDSRLNLNSVGPLYKVNTNASR